MELESLVVPAANAAEEAGNLINNLKNLWAEASMEEQRKLLLTMLDAVYIDAKKTRSIVAIRPKPPFKPIFQVAVTKEGSDIRIINEPIQGSPVFLVETGEESALSSLRVASLVKERRAYGVEFTSFSSDVRKF
jgi:ethanolamine ammonia-lyase large subunit